MIIANYIGTDRAEVNGVVYKATRDGNGVAPHVCRSLLKGGAEDQLIQFERNGTVCFEPRLLSDWAGRQFKDDEKGLREVEYYVFERGTEGSLAMEAV